MKDRFKESERNFESACNIKACPRNPSRYGYYNDCSAPLPNLGYNLDMGDKSNSSDNYDKQANEQNWTNYSTEQNQLGHTQRFPYPEKVTLGKDLLLLKELEPRPSSRASSRARPDDLDI